MLCPKGRVGSNPTSGTNKKWLGFPSHFCLNSLAVERRGEVRRITDLVNSKRVSRSWNAGRGSSDYDDLVAERQKRGADDVAIVRMERYYPIPVRTLPPAIAAYPADAEVRFVQEEPANQGAWPFMAMYLSDVIGRPVHRVSRPASSSPAVGSHHRHEVEQQTLVQAAFE